jgi:polyhydroxyalkanoate synthesis regulator phasin
MEPMIVAKQMIDLQKATFDNSFQAMVLFQEQTEKMANTLLEQTFWMPEEGRKVLGEWVKAYKQGRDEFKKVVDQNFKNAEAFFEVGEKPEKPEKPKTK